MTDDILLRLSTEADSVAEGSYQYLMCRSAHWWIEEKNKLADDATEALSRALELVDKKSRQIDVLKAALAENGQRNARQQKKYEKRG